MTYRVVFGHEAEEDLELPFNYAFERELNSASGDRACATARLPLVHGVIRDTARRISDN
jgi:hypothetical protein